MKMLEIIKSIIFGIVEGITEWLPISSTGHMILLDEFIKMNISEQFKEMYLVVIQLGAIMAVVLLFWWEIWPFCKGENFEKHYVKNKKISFLDCFKFVKQDIFIMWFKILVACIPAVIVELLWGDKLEAAFYNYQTVSIMLIVVGIVFILVENRNKNHAAKVDSIAGITYQTAFLIGMFQLIAAVFPGTSRSGATIIGGLMLGLSRTIAAEFTFYLAVPVMFGASFIKIIKFGLAFTGTQIAILLTGMVTAFVVSVVVIKFLMGYIKKHDFKVFGWYRIVLGALVLAYFMIK
ncbi:MAG: undecaprenyl-diphosphate phosphatase [Lachnospiraceae bacterium]|nr:undecaprenyl-diphosphate phosphatase [Lachnospiraceae bacterium]